MPAPEAPIRHAGQPPDKHQPRWIVIFCFFGFLTLLTLAIYTPMTIAAEDAVILRRYSRNLAEIGVISCGGPRAEGATDFLALHRSWNETPYTAWRDDGDRERGWGLGVVLLQMAGEKRQQRSILSIVGVLALFPQIQAALKGFSVLPFGLAISLTLMFTLEGNDVGEGQQSKRRIIFNVNRHDPALGEIRFPHTERTSAFGRKSCSRSNGVRLIVLAPT